MTTRVVLAVAIVNGRRFEIQRVLDQVERRVAHRAPLGCVGDGAARVEVAAHEPGAERGRVRNGDAIVAKQ